MSSLLDSCQESNGDGAQEAESESGDEAEEDRRRPRCGKDHWCTPLPVVLGTPLSWAGLLHQAAAAQAARADKTCNKEAARSNSAY